MKRFGELPDWVRARLEQASTAELERWGEELMETLRLDALFDADPSAR